MPKVRLTAQAVKGLPVPATGRVDYQDLILPGLVVRVSCTGAKSYSVSWWKDGARPRVTLGLSEDSPARGPAAIGERLSLADAREKAREVLRGVRVGVDPAAERREHKQAITFAALAREYVSKWAKPRKAPKGAREDERRIEHVLIPRWGTWKAADVRKRDVVELLDTYTDDGKPYARNRMQALISKVYNFGIKRDAVEINPAKDIDRELEKPRTRVLSDVELKALLPSFRSEGLAGIGFRLLLLTGQRPNEVFGMRWSEIDGDLWTLPAERSKNRRPNLVPLPSQARAALNELRTYSNGDGFVFPSRRHGKAMLSYQKSARRVKATAQLANDWNIYDLKSTCLTGLERLGVPGPVVSAVANHAPTTTTKKHYSFHDFADEKRDALAKWGDYVEKIDPRA